MADNYGPTFGAYTNVTGVIAAGSKAEIQANINAMKALLPEIEPQPHQDSPVRAPVSAASPDFQTIPPERSNQLRLELDALWAAINAAPEA